MTVNKIAISDVLMETMEFVSQDAMCLSLDTCSTKHHCYRIDLNNDESDDVKPARSERRADRD